MTVRTAPRIEAMDPEENAEPDASRMPRSIFELIRSLIDDVFQLLYQETELAKAEITESFRKAGRGAIIMAAGAAVLAVGFVILLFAAAVGIVALIQLTGLSTTASILVGLSSAGLLMAIVGIIAILIAKKKLSPQELKPKRTVKTLKGAKEWAEEKLHG